MYFNKRKLIFYKKKIIKKKKKKKKKVMLNIIIIIIVVFELQYCSNLRNIINAGLKDLFEDTGNTGYQSIWDNYISSTAIIPICSASYDSLDDKQKNELFGTPIKVGWYSEKYPPYTINMTLEEGFDPDMIKNVFYRIENHYGITIPFEFIDVKKLTTGGYFNNVKEAVETGFVDFVLSPTSIRSEREDEVDFSCPYVINKLYLGRSNLDESLVLDTLEKINKPEVKFGVLEGSMQVEIINDLFPDATQVVGTNEVDMLINGEVHLILDDDKVIGYLIPIYCQNCKIIQISELNSTSEAGIVFKSGSTRFIFNMVLFVVLSILFLFF